MARRPPRVPLVVDIEYAADSAPLRRRTRNIGAGGLFIETADPPPEGTPVRVRFALPEQARPMTVEAVVVWAEPLLGMGLRFTWLDPDDETAIKRYVLRQVHGAGDEAGARLHHAIDPPDRGGGAPTGVAADGPASTTRTLYLAVPSEAFRTRLQALLAAEMIISAKHYPDLLAIPLSDGVLPRLSAGLRARLTDVERQRCKAVVLAGRSRPTLSDLVRMPSLGTLLATLEGESLRTMLNEERVVSHFQPIVEADAPAAVFGYEGLVRGLAADGSLVGPQELYAMARAAGLLFPLDRLARLSAVRGAAAHRLTSRLFINVNPTSLGDTDEHLEATCQAIAEAGLAPTRVVFEIVESDRIEDVPRLLRILAGYRAAGFAVALDDLGAGYSSLTLLTQLRPDLVKLDMALVRGIDGDGYRAEIVARLLESARALGIRTVAEGVETEAEWRWFRAHRTDFVQGFLFARPGLPPPLPRVPPSPLVEG